MAISGLIGAGAQQGLDEVIQQVLAQKKFQEQIRAQQAVEMIQKARMAQDASQHQDVMGFRNRQQDFTERMAGEESQQRSIDDLRAQQESQRQRLGALNQQDAMEGLSKDASLQPKIRAMLDVVNRSGGAVKPSPISPEDFMSDAERKAEEDAAVRLEGRKAAASRDPNDGKQQWLLRNGQAVYDLPAPGDTPYDRTRTGERPVLSSDANRIADIDNSLAIVDRLKEQIGQTGASSKLGAMVWNPVTEMTGFGQDAKKRQALINGAKQIIGKALEGGVLRKEDEAKYDRILPTIGDDPGVAQAKLDGLRQALEEKRSTTLEALGEAGYGVDKLRREAGPKPMSSHGGSSGPAVGSIVTVKGRRVRVTAVHPDGTFEGEPQ